MNTVFHGKMLWNATVETMSYTNHQSFKKLFLKKMGSTRSLNVFFHCVYQSILEIDNRWVDWNGERGVAADVYRTYSYEKDKQSAYG